MVKWYGRPFVRGAVPVIIDHVPAPLAALLDRVRIVEPHPRRAASLRPHNDMRATASVLVNVGRRRRSARIRDIVKEPHYGLASIPIWRSRWITSPESRADVHRLRAAHDAVVAGVGTVLTDDPALTVRTPDGALTDRQPLRVVVDSAAVWVV